MRHSVGTDRLFVNTPLDTGTSCPYYVCSEQGEPHMTMSRHLAEMEDRLEQGLTLTDDEIYKAAWQQFKERHPEKYAAAMAKRDQIGRISFKSAGQVRKP